VLLEIRFLTNWTFVLPTFGLVLVFNVLLEIDFPSVGFFTILAFVRA